MRDIHAFGVGVLDLHVGDVDNLIHLAGEFQPVVDAFGHFLHFLLEELFQFQPKLSVVDVERFERYPERLLFQQGIQQVFGKQELVAFPRGFLLGLIEGLLNKRGA